MAQLHPIFVFEVALGIDLDHIERLLGGASGRQTFRHRGRETSFLHYRPAPLRVTQEGTPVRLDQWETAPTADLMLYDFGAASVTYLVELEDDLGVLAAASAQARRSEALRDDARTRIQGLLGRLEAAVNRPRIADLSEDYAIVGLSEAPGGGAALAYCEAHAEAIAQILRPDPAGLSADEIRNATELRISFGPSDVTIVDWDAAFVLDPAPDDVRAVLEFANVQLLEMRWLDLQLDLAIERSYQLLARGQGWRALLPSSVSADVRQVAELQLEGAVLLERVVNALKVFGEEYLARIYRLAARRFQLAELDRTISRKLATIESIYQKLSDRSAARRLELLEWVVILLIALEIVLELAR